MYYITTKKGNKLSYWYSGDMQSRRHIIGSRKNDWWAFKSKKEAQEKLNYMLSEIPKNTNRWGEKTTRQVSVYINNLSIIKE